MATKPITYTINASGGHLKIGTHYSPFFNDLHLGVVKNNLIKGSLIKGNLIKDGRDVICISAYPIFGNVIGCVDCQEECEARDIMLSRRNK